MNKDRNKSIINLNDSQNVNHKDLEDFTQEQKEAILRRDGYKCVICGKGLKDGVELDIGYIEPVRLGGKAIMENGQTLCVEHSLMKKSLSQTEIGKKIIIRLYKIAKKEGAEKLIEFCEDILKIYEKYHIDSHIEWDK